MDLGSEILRTVRDLEAELRHSRQLDHDFYEHRKEAIGQRREVSAKLGLIAAAIPSILDDDVRVAFQNQFSKMRSAMALHQASWPIVAIDQDDQAYQESLENMRRSYFEFFDWVRRP